MVVRRHLTEKASFVPLDGSILSMSGATLILPIIDDGVNPVEARLISDTLVNLVGEVFFQASSGFCMCASGTDWRGIKVDG